MNVAIERAARALLRARAERNSGMPAPEEPPSWALEAAGADVRMALKAIREPTEAMVAHGAASLDHPSTYMGGPSLQSKRKAERVWSAMIDAALSDMTGGEG